MACRLLGVHLEVVTAHYGREFLVPLPVILPAGTPAILYNLILRGKTDKIEGVVKMRLQPRIGIIRLNLHLYLTRILVYLAVRYDELAEKLDAAPVQAHQYLQSALLRHYPVIIGVNELQRPRQLLPESHLPLIPTVFDGQIRITRMARPERTAAQTHRKCYFLPHSL